MRLDNKFDYKQTNKHTSPARPPSRTAVRHADICVAARWHQPARPLSRMAVCGARMNSCRTPLVQEAAAFASEADEVGSDSPGHRSLLLSFFRSTHTTDHRFLHIGTCTLLSSCSLTSSALSTALLLLRPRLFVFCRYPPLRSAGIAIPATTYKERP